MGTRLLGVSRHFFVIALTFASMSLAYAMEIEFVHNADYSQNHIVLKGEIRSGDYKKLESMYLSPLRGPQDFGAAMLMTAPIHLDSKGGNVDEALKIADLINRLSRAVIVSGTCASACSLLYMAGATRYVADNGRVGLHRIYFNPVYYQNLPMVKARHLYEKNEQVFKEQMLKYGLPQHLFEKMMRTPSDSVYWLNHEDVENIGMWPPYMEERLIAQCGARPIKQGPYLDSWLVCMQETLGTIARQSLFSFRKSKGLSQGGKEK